MMRWPLLAVHLMSTCTFAQSDLQGDALREAAHLSGLGVIGEPILGETNCAPNGAGEREIELLASIEGPVVANLEWRSNGGCTAFLVRNGPTEQLYGSWDLVEISYESAAVVYYEQRGEFARVFERRAPPGFWLRITDIPGGRLRPWVEVLTETPRSYLGYEGLRLHEEPSPNSIVLTNLRDRQNHDSRVHELIPTGEVSGTWGQFDVVEWSGDFNVMTRTESPTPTGQRWQGWLSLLDEQGQPAFWFYTRD